MESMSIAQLADSVGLSRRAIRFYVQRGLIPAPDGRGRGAGYGPEHLDRLKRVLQLQAAGHSLEAILRIIDQSPDQTHPPPPAKQSRSQARPTLSAELWTHVRLLDGFELQFDVRKHELSPEQLLALRQAALQILGKETSDE